MRLFWISFALLLYANLTHAVDLGSVTGESAKNLAPVPVDNIEGSRCSNASANYVNVPEKMRNSDICKREGFMKYFWFLYAVARVTDIDKDTPNKTYMCCIDSMYVCRKSGDFHIGPIEVVAEKDENGKEWKTAVDCSGSKSCQDPKKYFCTQEAANALDHLYRPDTADRLKQYRDVPLCCPKFKEDKCEHEKSDYTGVDPNGDDCEKNFGRCKADDHTLLCSKKTKNEKASSCCKPHKTELCPFGIYPFGLKGKNGLVDWIASNSGDVETWKQACLDLASKPEFAGGKSYISGEKCCAKPKLNEEANHGLYWNRLSDQYERLSTSGCKTDADCGEGNFCGTVTSSYNNESATGKACFEKIHCPHKTKTVYPIFSTDNPMTCFDSKSCSNGTICVWGKPAAATAAKIEKNIGMCCPKAAYEDEMCSADFLGDPLNKKTGLIDPAILDQKDCQGGSQKWGTLDTGAGGTGEDKTEVCCQYPPVQIHNSTCTAVIMGNRTITGIPVEDPVYPGRYLPCEKEGKRKADEPKISCGNNYGFCFTDPSKPEDFRGVCCDTELCPDGMTALLDVPVCDDSCIWSNSPEKDKYCIEDKNKIKKCCTPKFIPTPSGQNESTAPKNTEDEKCCPKKPELSLMVDMICFFGSFLASIAIFSLIYVICHVGAKWKTAKMMKKAGMTATGVGKATGKGTATGH